MTIIPVNSKLLVQPEKKQDISPGGIILIESDEYRPSAGYVIESACEIFKKGQHIMFDKYAGTRLIVDNEEHIILNPEDIFAIIP